MSGSKNGVVLAAFLLAGLLPIDGQQAQAAGILPLNYGANCTRDNEIILLEAQLNVSKLINESVVAIEFMHDTPAYRESFGAYDKTRHAKIRKRLNAIHEGVKSVSIDAKCEAPGHSKTCDRGAWAYITKQSAAAGTLNDYVINFCPSYFSASDELVRSYNQWSYAKTMQAAVFLHELTHFAWPLGGGGGDTHTMIAGTIDKRYDERGVKRLAEKKPDKAIQNADSYHVFLMKLNTMNRIMFFN